MKKSIYPKLQEAASKIPIQRSGVRHNSQDLAAALKKQSEALHAEIDSLSRIERMDSKHLAAIDQQDKQINQSIYKITQVILDLHNLLDSNDDSLITEYTSRIEEFKNCSLQFNVILPTFITQDIKRTDLRTIWSFIETIYNIPNQVDC